MLTTLINMTEVGLIPNPLIRVGIRYLCDARLKSLKEEEIQNSNMKADFLEMLRRSSVAVETKAANEQHYEVPAAFYLNCLGPNLKYSCAYWPAGCNSLSEAEKLSLEITMERAELQDGQKILELGCGWGSLTLAMAEKFPAAKITAISNSASQKKYILDQAKARGFDNIEVLTKDVSVLEDLGDGRNNYDRVVSVEMFEHLRNYEMILSRICKWLAPHGKLFIHIFTHKKYPYLFETEGADNWMGKYFFTGGQMPSATLLKEFQKDLKLQKQWEWDGTHYQKTSEAWLANMEKNKKQVMQLFTDVYGKQEAVRWFNRWKVFYLAVAELFGYRKGSEWGVSHYLFAKKD